MITSSCYCKRRKLNMFVILWFIFGIFVNVGNGAMIHASEHSEIPANISLTSDSFTYPDKYGNPYKDGDFGLSIRLWASSRLCPSSVSVTYSFSISTSQSTCKFFIDKRPQSLTFSSQILGNVQWQNYEFGVNDTSYDEEVLLNLTIFNNNGNVQVFGHVTDLRCYANMFNNESVVSITAKETTRCRFAVLVQGMKTGINFDVPDQNILHNYYIDKYTLISIFSVLCTFIIALDLASTIYFCFT